MNLVEAYEILDLEFKSPIFKVKKSFKELSKRYHPDKCKNSSDTSQIIQINKAYNHILAFDELHNLSEIPSLPTQQLPPNEYTLSVTLEEIFRGCLKSVQIKRKVVNEMGNHSHEEACLNVTVKPGHIENTKITIFEAGDQEHGKIAANAVFIIQLERHNLFKVSKLSKFDLEYVSQISHEEAILGCRIQIPTLENVPVELQMNEVITKDTVRKIVNRGLPYPNVQGKRGDLYVLFDIIFKQSESKPKPKPKDPSIERNLFLTLEQILNGCEKIIQIERSVVGVNYCRVLENKNIKIKIKPGTEPGTKYTFPMLGDQNPETIPADIVFVVCDKPHLLFQRSGVDIVYTALITLEEAFLGTDRLLSIPTLENDFISLLLEGTVDIETKHKIEGRGLPYQHDSQCRGDLIVQFEMVEQDDPIEEDIYLTAEEVNEGCIKEIEFALANRDLNATKYFVIKIQPGTQFGTRFTFPKEGIQIAGKIPADITFVVRNEMSRNVENSFSSELSQNQSDQVSDFDPITRYLDYAYQTRFNAQPNLTSLTVLRGDFAKRDKSVKSIFILEQSATLEELLHGCIKNVNVYRKVINQYNHAVNERKTLKIQIKPGTSYGTLFLFPQEGDCICDAETGDVLIKLCKESHPFFKQLNNNVDLEYALSGYDCTEPTVEVPTLEGQMKSINISGENSNVRLSGLGLPHFNNEQVRGDLIVTHKRPSLNGTKYIEPQFYQEPPVEHELLLSLEDVLNGRKKRMKINRQIIDSNGNVNFEDKIITIDIKPGTESGTRFAFFGEGDRSFDSFPADVVFVTKDKPNETFVRDRMNIIYTARLSSAVNNLLQIPTLEGNEVQLEIGGSISDGCSRPIVGYGLPHVYNSNTRGDIVVQVVDDRCLMDSTRILIKEILSQFNPSEEAPIEADRFEQESPKPNYLRKIPLKTTRSIDKERRKSQIAPAALNLVLTSDEMTNGCTKEHKIRRQIFQEDRSMRFEYKTLTINVEAGVEVGSKIVLPAEGDQVRGLIPADVVFVVKEVSKNI